MSETILPGTIYRESEFARLPDGTKLTGACGPNALSMGLSWVRQQRHGTVEVMQRMLAAGLCDGNGVTTLNKLHEAAATLWHLPIAGFRAYGEPWAAYAGFLGQYAGRQFICLNVAEGWALVDTLTGEHENANIAPNDPKRLRYHLLGVVGRHDGGHSAHANRDLPAGWWCVDGDNFSGATLVYYPDAVLGAAQPCGAFALSGGPTMSYTKNADGSITYPNGVTLRTATAQYVMTHALSATPLQAEAYLGTRWGYTPFDDGTVLTWDTQQQAVRTDCAGIIIQGLSQELAQARDGDQADAATQRALAVVAAIKAALEG